MAAAPGCYQPTRHPRGISALWRKPQPRLVSPGRRLLAAPLEAALVLPPRCNSPCRGAPTAPPQGDLGDEPAETGSSTPRTPTSGLCDHPSLRNRSESQTKKKWAMWGVFFSRKMVRSGSTGAALPVSVQRLMQAEPDPWPAPLPVPAACLHSVSLLCPVPCGWHSQRCAVSASFDLHLYFLLLFFTWQWLGRGFLLFFLSLCASTKTGAPV